MLNNTTSLLPLMLAGNGLNLRQSSLSPLQATDVAPIPETLMPALLTELWQPAADPLTELLAPTSILDGVSASPLDWLTDGTGAEAVDGLGEAEDPEEDSILQILMMLINMIMPGALGGLTPPDDQVPLPEGEDPVPPDPDAVIQDEADLAPPQDEAQANAQADAQAGTDTNAQATATAPTPAAPQADAQAGAQANAQASAQTGAQEVFSEASAVGAPAQVWGDPHFVSFDGKNYDVQGTANDIYNIISDKKLQFNAKFVPFANPGTTVIGDVGLKIGDPQNAARVQFSASGPATVNGEALQPGSQKTFRTGIRNQQGQEVHGYARLSPDGNVLTVNTGEYTITFTKKTSDGVAHLDKEVRVNQGTGAKADGVLPHGLLGQTVDHSYANRNAVEGAKQGEGMIEGDVTKYRVNSGDIFGDDFAFNRFGSEGGPAEYGYRVGAGGTGS